MLCEPNLQSAVIPSKVGQMLSQVCYWDGEGTKYCLGCRFRRKANYSIVDFNITIYKLYQFIDTHC